MSILSGISPFQIIWRNGTSEPYIDFTETLQIVNGFITLSEVPDPVTRVKIAGFSELQPDEYNKKRRIDVGQFWVDYNSIRVYFNPAENGKSVLVDYKGRGSIQVASSQIVHRRSETSDVVESLDEIIDHGLDVIKDVELAVVEMNKTIGEFEDTIGESLRIYKPYVESYSSLLSIYPEPELGWTVLTVDTGITYRWDGSNWVGIETLDTYPYQASRSRVLQFVITGGVKVGVDSVVLRFPFNGQIVDAYAHVNTSGHGRTEIAIEKISQDDFDGSRVWSNIFSINLSIDGNEYSSKTSSTPYLFLETEVEENDHFRLNILSTSGDVKDLTVELTIKV